MSKEKHDYLHLRKIRSRKHPGAIFIQGERFICKVYAYASGSENNKDADVIIKAIVESRIPKEKEKTK